MILDIIQENGLKGSFNVENLRNKIDKISYILKYGLAQRRILVYNKKLIIILKYEFVVKNIGNSKNVLDKNERKLVEIRQFLNLNEY